MAFATKKAFSTFRLGRSTHLEVWVSSFLDVPSLLMALGGWKGVPLLRVN